MPQFSINDKVINVLSSKKGTIMEVCPSSRGRQNYMVVFEGDISSKMVMEHYLKPDFDIRDPFERCEQNVYGSFDEFSRINTSFKIEHSNNSSISSLKASKTLFKAYQFKPLLKFLNSDNHRLLIADEVGLGKTIEAGHIMLELKARNELHNVLVVCPRSLQAKWKKELEDKFGLVFDIYQTSAELQLALQDHDGIVRGIVNYEKLQFKPSQKNKDKADEKSLVGFIQKKRKKFSLILCDEAHRMRNAGTQTYRGAEILMRHAQSIVFLTATPIMINEDNLFNLMHLLDEQRFDDLLDFRNAVSLNKPFIRALSQLSSNNYSLKQIATDLSEAIIETQYIINDEYAEGQTAKVKEWFKDFPIYKRIIDRMRRCKDTPQLRVDLQQDLTEMSQMSGVFTRTRKSEVITDWSQAHREPHLVKVELSQSERDEFDEVINQYIDDHSWTSLWGEVELDQGAALGLVQKKRQVASSVFAFLNSDKDLEQGHDAFINYKDSKIEKLQEVMNAVFSSGTEKIIVFALFKKTLRYLKIRLDALGIECALIHGGVPSKDREKELERFKTDPSVKVLLSSEVGSEGLDMQFCHSLVNYDLPWNPMVVEQRIGRIDRFGQRSPVVNIYNFVVADSIQEEIYERLLKRIGIFRSSIGDMEAILDAEVEEDGKTITIKELYQHLEKDLFCMNLSEKDRKNKYEKIAQAVERQKKQLKDIEEGLTNALTNDSYFKQEIDRILYNTAYVTERELYTYVEVMFNAALPTCSFNALGNEIYEIKIDPVQPKILSSFLHKYQPVDRDQAANFQSFRNRIEGETAFKVTFSQEVAFNNPSLIYVNVYHPIVQASLGYYKNNLDENNTVFKIEIEKPYLPKQGKKNLVAGDLFFLAIYQIDTERNIQGQRKAMHNMFPVLYDIDSCAIIQNDALSQEVFGVLQRNGHNMNNPSSLNLDKQFILDFHCDLNAYVEEYIQRLKDELQIKIENDRKKREQLVMDQSRVRLGRLEANAQKYENALNYYKQFNDQESKDAVRNLKGALQLADAAIDKENEKTRTRLAQIRMDAKLSVDFNLVSLNLVKIV